MKMTDPQQIPGPKNAEGVFDTISGKELRWTDQRGLVHVVVGADVHEGVRLLWTLCERDVPAGKAWLRGNQYKEPDGGYEVCATCMKHRNAVQNIRAEEAREAKHADSQFGVGA